MKKIVMNYCYGGFVISDWAKKQLGIEDSVCDEWFRQDPRLIELIEKYGSEACSHSCSSLDIEEYDDDEFDFEIDEYDGAEMLKLIPIIKKDIIGKFVRNGDVDGLLDYLERKKVNLK